MDKGRQKLREQAHGRDLMQGYLFGDRDYMDGQLLTFLNTNEARVLELLQDSDNDQTVAEALIHESGRTAGEIRAWNEQLYRKNGLFLKMIDADEGRRSPGLGTAVYRFVYNSIIMPPTYLFFRLTEGRRQKKG